ncbi:MAG TPA: fasciclin domain-containing protein, partial [Puia sp.]|nr:fasciclin domain-containing protein [Puia sp.]
LLGIPLYIGRDGAGNLLLNGFATAANKPASVGRATVYWLNSMIPPGADSLTELLQTDSALTLFAQLIGRTNLYDSLLLTGGFTVLAPVNSALLQAGYDSLSIDTGNIDTLIRVAQNQVVKGAWFSTTFPPKLTTLTGGMITVAVVNGIPQFSGAGNPTPVHWLKGDQVAGAGLILHHVDGVLSP